MKEPFDLERYLTAGVENIVKGAMKISLKNHRESLFMARYLVASRKAAALRRSAEERGEHIPPFLIASVTTACNLHCAGCYARANHACLDTEAEGQMSDETGKRSSLRRRAWALALFFWQEVNRAPPGYPDVGGEIPGDPVPRFYQRDDV